MRKIIWAYLATACAFGQFASAQEEPGFLPGGTMEGGAISSNAADPGYFSEPTFGLANYSPDDETVTTTSPRLEKTADLQELSKGLGYDPLRIFNYVRNKIDSELYFGLKKGPRLTLLEESGNDLDKAMLLGALLEIAFEKTQSGATVSLGHRKETLMFHEADGVTPDVCSLWRIDGNAPLYKSAEFAQPAALVAWYAANTPYIHPDLAASVANEQWIKLSMAYCYALKVGYNNVDRIEIPASADRIKIQRFFVKVSGLPGGTVVLDPWSVRYNVTPKYALPLDGLSTGGLVNAHVAGPVQDNFWLPETGEQRSWLTPFTETLNARVNQVSTHLKSEGVLGVVGNDQIFGRRILSERNYSSLAEANVGSVSLNTSSNGCKVTKGLAWRLKFNFAAGTEKELYLPSLAGRRLSVHTENTGTVYSLSLGVEKHLFGDNFSIAQLASHTLASGKKSVALTSKLILPFENVPALEASANYTRNTESSEQLRAAHAIFYGFSPKGGLLRARQSRLDEILQCMEKRYPGSTTATNLGWTSINGSNGGDERVDRRAIVLETLNVAGLDWLRQTQLMRSGIEDVFEANIGKSFSLGKFSQDAGYSIDVYQQIGSSSSRDGNYNERGGEIAALYASMLLESALEHSIVEQVGPGGKVVVQGGTYTSLVRLDGVSTVNILMRGMGGLGVVVRDRTNTTDEIPTEQVGRILYTGTDHLKSFFDLHGSKFDSSNLPWVPPPIAFTSGTAVGYFLKDASLTANGYDTTDYTESSGVAYFSPGVIKMTVGGLYGGLSPNADPIEPVVVFENDYTKPGYFDISSALKLIDTSQASYSMFEQFGADPVNVANGGFEHSEEDLVLGSGEAPMGLSFKRDYSSLRARHDPAGLGFGWTHNWDIRLSETTDAAAALGATIPRHAASFITAVKLMEEVLIPPRYAAQGETAYHGYLAESVNPKRWMVLGAISKYLGDQIANNAITVSMGRESETFVRTPAGSYEASSGSTMSFSMDGLYAKGTLKQRHGNTIEFSGMYSPEWGFRRSRATKIVGPYGQTVDISWGSYGVSQVVSTAGSVTRKLVFTYGSTGSNHLQRVDEVVGGSVIRSVVFSHAGGNLISSTDPENLSPAQATLSGGSTTYQYQPAGGYGVSSCLSGMWDPMGRQVVWNEYDAFCRVTEQDSGIIESESSHLLKPWKFRYAGVATEEQDPLGGIKRYEFDARGRLIAQADALGFKSSNTYDEEDRVVLTVDPRGARVETKYDTGNNPREIREYRNSTATVPYTTYHTYDSLFRPLTSTDANGRVTTLTYPTGSINVDPESVTKDGKTTTYVYETGNVFSKGLLLQEIDEEGTMVTKEYNAQGYLFKEKLPGDFVTEYTTRSPSGDATSVKDAAGRVSTFTFNKRRQTTSHTKTDTANPSYSLVESSLYDAAGRLAYEATNTGRSGGKKVRTFEYLSSGKPTYTRYGGADGLMWTSDDTFELNVYDEREWLVKSFDVNGNATNFTFLANGWNDVTHLPDDPKLGSRTTSVTEYDASGRAKVATDVLGRQTSTNYAEHTTDSGISGLVSDKTTVTDPATFTMAEWKDAMGNLRVTQDKRGKKYVMDYDAWDRLTRTTTPVGRYFESTYRADGRVNSAIKGQGSTKVMLVNGYDAVTRRLSMTFYPYQGKTVNYTSYDANGNLLAANEGTKSVTRSYDYFDRVKTYKNADGWTIGYEYYNDGMLKRIYYPDSATDTNPFDNDSVLYNYDQQGRLKTITDWSNRVTTYYWRTDGRLQSIARPNGTVRQLTYDSLSRVIGFTERDAAGNILHLQRLDYRKTEDLASTFTHPVAPSSGGNTPVSLTSAVFGDDNEMSSVTTSAGSHTLQTDERGNLTKAVLDGSGVSATLSFDERDRLTGIDSTIDTSYTYDLEGNRISMTHGGATTNYVFDPHGGALVRMLVRIDSTGKKTRYVYGVGLDYEVDQTTGQAKYYHYDFTGSTAAITNQTGTVTDRYFYTPYGQVKHATGTTDTPFKFGGFMGVITDPNGLLSMRARFYSPILCRFVSMDPAKFEGGMNWYAYATGNPLTLGDPSGFGPESTLDAIQTGLSVLGMMPVVGFAFDLVNAGISIYRGNYGDAMLNMFSAIPGIGDLAGAAKLEAGAMKMMDVGLDAGRASRGMASEIVGPCPGFCFVAGTEIDTQDGAKPIEALRVGDRVSTTDGNSSSEIVPESWRQISLQMPNPECPADLIDIELLRSVEWTASTSCRSGGRMWLELEEMGLRGWANVQSVSECPEIQSGQGRVVLATVTHLNTFVMDVRLEGDSEPLRPTDRHRLFSVTRNDWIPTASLQVGEVLRTADGTAQIESVQPWPGTHRVFNIEVETEHSYFAGRSKVLSHNTNPCGLSLQPANSGIVNRGGRFADLDALKLEGEVGHHVPQNAFNKTKGLSRADGPAIGMTKEDHALTRTYAGRGKQTMRSDGELGLNERQRLYLDIKDLRSNFGTKYNRGSLEAINYAKTLPGFQK